MAEAEKEEEHLVPPKGEAGDRSIKDIVRFEWTFVTPFNSSLAWVQATTSRWPFSNEPNSVLFLHFWLCYINDNVAVSFSISVSFSVCVCLCALWTSWHLCYLCDALFSPTRPSLPPSASPCLPALKCACISAHDFNWLSAIVYGLNHTQACNSWSRAATAARTARTTSGKAKQPHQNL